MSNLLRAGGASRGEHALEIAERALALSSMRCLGVRRRQRIGHKTDSEIVGVRRHPWSRSIRRRAYEGKKGAVGMPNANYTGSFTSTLRQAAVQMRAITCFSIDARLWWRCEAIHLARGTMLL